METAVNPILVPTLDTARKTLEIVDQGLCYGMGKPVPGQLCVEAAVCLAHNLPHSDQPPCVEAAVRSFKIGLNDQSWSSPAARAKGLRRIAIAQLGSAGVVNGQEFTTKLAEKVIRVLVPIALRAAATLLTGDLSSHAVALEAAAVRCETEGTQAASRAASRAASAASWAASAASEAASRAASAASWAASAASEAASRAASRAASAASWAASAASEAASAASEAASAASEAASRAASAASEAASAASWAARDAVLSKAADIGVDVLRELKSPGIQWMDELISAE